MMKIVAGVALGLAFCGSALAQTCPTYTYTLSNGTTADAVQVMSNFNQIRTCAVNTSGGTLTGGTLAGTTSLPGSGAVTSSGNLGLGLTTPVGSLHLRTSQSPSGGYAYGLIAQDNVNAAVSGDFRAIYANPTLLPGSYTVNNVMSAYIGDAVKGSGTTINNDYGIYIPNIVNGITNYAIFSQGGQVYFGGNVGIGTSTPGYLLTVNGTAYASGAAGALSDVRHKDKITTLQPGALGVVEKLRPVTFVWKDPKDDGMRGEQIGFIAQEVQKVLPSVVLTDKDKDKTLGIKYTEIIPVLTKAIQEQQAEIENLKTELAALKTAH